MWLRHLPPLTDCHLFHSGWFWFDVTERRSGLGFGGGFLDGLVQPRKLLSPPIEMTGRHYLGHNLAQVGGWNPGPRPWHDLVSRRVNARKIAMGQFLWQTSFQLSIEEKQNFKLRDGQSNSGCDSIVQEVAATGLSEEEFKRCRFLIRVVINIENRCRWYNWD
jgi:hypothetical protein